MELSENGTSVIYSGSPEETEEAGELLARLIVGETHAFVALSGELGAGKTAFVRGFARILSPGSTVKSPTYTVVNEYTHGGVPVYHFDLYRITDTDDLYSIGYHDYIGTGVCIAEWSERAGDELPLPRYSVSIEKTGGSSRKITVTYISKGGV